MKDIKIGDRDPRKLIMKKIAKTLNLQRFLIVGETKAKEGHGKAFITCWNGKEFQNQIDLVGLLALGTRAISNEDSETEDV